MKVIEVQFPNGEIWHVDAVVIARSRASYYAHLDFERGDVDDLDKAIEAEYKFTYNDDYELMDWAVNSMDWDDFEGFVRKIEKPSSIDYNKEWTNTKRKVITLESES